MRAYRNLLLAALAAALVVSVLARLPHRPRSAPAAAPAVPVTELALAYADGRLTPASASVPKGHRVALTISNCGTTPVTLGLAGYADRLRAGPVAPGATWRGGFLADLPGEDFAWLAEGSPDPVGRLSVTGSHLVEGHR
jgi:hypothetical protein